MSQERESNENKHEDAIKIIRAIENRDWTALDHLTGMSPEEAERILREEPMIDAAIVHRLMEEMDKEDDRQAGLANDHRA